MPQRSGSPCTDSDCILVSTSDLQTGLRWIHVAAGEDDVGKEKNR
jgi:hypothetical protein